MKETGAVLLYNFSGERDRDIISLCEACGLKVIHVCPADYGAQIGSLFEKENPDTDFKAFDQQLLPFSEEMMVIAADGDTLGRLLQLFGEKGVKPVALKAMLTRTNASWTSADLFEHLKEEHAWMAARRKQMTAGEEKTNES